LGASSRPILLQKIIVLTQQSATAKLDSATAREALRRRQVEPMTIPRTSASTEAPPAFGIGAPSAFGFTKAKYLPPATSSRSFFNLKVFIKVGLGISRTNADSLCNPVYNVFHRNFCCGNEMIRQFCTRDLDAANLRPALEQVCGMQTPSDRKLFFRANLLYVPNIKL